MARNTTRVGRRRRVLNEEVLSASNIAIHTGSGGEEIEPGDTPRYGAGANIENHPQVTSFVPRRFRMLCLVALVGIGVSVTAELVSHYADPLSKFSQVVTAQEITTAFSDKLVAWTSAVCLLLTAGYTRLIYSLRRHRVDDYKGRYRVWRTVGGAAILVSLNVVVGGHELLSRCLGNLVEWQVLPGSAGWWLAPAVLLGGWLLTKLAIDAAECRSALTMYILSIACLTVAGVHSAGWTPALVAEWPGLLSRALPLLSYTFFLVGSMLFARYVVLDVQGLIEHPIHEAPPATDQAHIEIAVPDKSGAEQNEPAEAIEEEQVSTWVDGTEPEHYEDEQEGRRLSKAERKRLRKQKQRRAA